MTDLCENWGRFSAKGSTAFETWITEKVKELTDLIQNNIPETDYRSLILLGGYGRGEGGIIQEKDRELPHNNLDLMFVTHKLTDKEEETLNNKIRRLLDIFEENNDEFSLDCSLISAGKLKAASCLIMWYDMYNGHKTLLGDDSFIPSLKQFSIEKIPAWDAKNLLINRGTLLLINDLILTSGQVNKKLQKLIVKHAMKAIIGYGDALLFFHGQYHWSYLEKLKRIEAMHDIDFEFRQLYIKAAEFRLTADYTPYLKRDLKSWMEELRKLLNPIMLDCERRRLRDKDLSWHNYLEKATAAALIDDVSLKGIARKIRNLSIQENASEGLPAVSSFGFKSMNHTARLALFFPLAAFQINDNAYLRKACTFFEKGGLTVESLCREYLLYWGKYVDRNFSNVIKKYGMDL